MSSVKTVPLANYSTHTAAQLASFDGAANVREPALDRVHTCFLNALVTPLWMKTAIQPIKAR